LATGRFATGSAEAFPAANAVPKPASPAPLMKLRRDVCFISLFFEFKGTVKQFAWLSMNDQVLNTLIQIETKKNAIQGTRMTLLKSLLTRSGAA
jgi:hypothetical protein